MNQRAIAPPRAAGLLLVLLLSLLLAACGGDKAAAEPPLKGSPYSGRFSLTDQDGRRITDRQFAGRYRLVYFGFANCPDVCPVDLQVMGQGLRRFEAKHPERAERVQPIFITVDPARDTPHVLKAYVANFHPRLIGLTGTDQEIKATLRAHGGSDMGKEETPSGGYNINHSRYMILMGPEAEPIAIVPHETPDAVAAGLDRWVR
jgi:protein SCO1/2